MYAAAESTCRGLLIVSPKVSVPNSRAFVSPANANRQSAVGAPDFKFPKTREIVSSPPPFFFVLFVWPRPGEERDRDRRIRSILSRARSLFFDFSLSLSLSLRPVPSDSIHFWPVDRANSAVDRYFDLLLCHLRVRACIAIKFSSQCS